jgi:hypothetical protein
MPLLQIDILELPTAPLDAAADFYTTELPEIRDDADILAEHDLVLVFAPAGHEHRSWRLAAVQELAREFAPRRVNAVVGDDEDAIMAAMRFLDAAPGITGQLLAVDAVGAGNSGN